MSGSGPQHELQHNWAITNEFLKLARNNIDIARLRLKKYKSGALAFNWRKIKSIILTHPFLLTELILTAPTVPTAFDENFSVCLHDEIYIFDEDPLTFLFFLQHSCFKSKATPESLLVCAQLYPFLFARFWQFLKVQEKQEMAPTTHLLIDEIIIAARWLAPLKRSPLFLSFAALLSDPCNAVPILQSRSDNLLFVLSQNGNKIARRLLVERIETLNTEILKHLSSLMVWKANVQLLLKDCPTFIFFVNESINRNIFRRDEQLLTLAREPRCAAKFRQHAESLKLTAEEKALVAQPDPLLVQFSNLSLSGRPKPSQKPVRDPSAERCVLS